MIGGDGLVSSSFNLSIADSTSALKVFIQLVKKSLTAMGSLSVPLLYRSLGLSRK